jgi:hypothetical protein
MGGDMRKRRLWFLSAVIALLVDFSRADAVTKRLVLKGTNCEVSEMTYGGYTVYEPTKGPNGDFMSPLEVEGKTVCDYICRESGTTLSCVSEKPSAIFGEMEVSRDSHQQASAPAGVIYTSSTALMSIRGKDYFFAIHRFVKVGNGVAVRTKECYGAVQ